MTWVAESLPYGVQGTNSSFLSILWLLMAGQHKEPGHQQHWFGLVLLTEYSRFQKKRKRGLILELAAVLFLKYSQLNILSKHFLEQQSFKY